MSSGIEAAVATAVLTIAYGTVDDLDDLPAFLTAIRRGAPPSPELAAEMRRRYEAIGGRSPLNDICCELTRRLGDRLGIPAAFAGRYWRPSVDDVLACLARQGASRVVVVPLAPYSADEYVGVVRVAANDRIARGEPPVEVVGSGNWGDEPRLVTAFAASLRRVLVDLADPSRSRARVLMTAHSLPLSARRLVERYEREVRTAAEAVARAVGDVMPPYEVVFQSRGMGGGEWLGPDVPTTLARLADEGVRNVVFAPIGFVADHAEVLYDLDIEARGWAEARGMRYARMESLNAGDGIVDAVEAVARRKFP
jgi:ferrochelatase